MSSAEISNDNLLQAISEYFVTPVTIKFGAYLHTIMQAIPVERTIYINIHYLGVDFTSEA
jgi:hypothetical protein